MRKTYLILMLCTLTGCGSGQDVSTAQAPGTTVTPTGPEVDAAKPGTQPASLTGAAPSNAAATAGTREITPEQGLTLARELIVKKDYQNALQVLTQVIRARPDFTEAYIQRANLLAAANRPLLAVDDLTAAIQLQGDDAKLWNSRGYLYLIQQQYDLALGDFEKATSLDTSFAQPINNRGLVRVGQGDFATALKDFEYALQLDPKYFDALNNRGFTLVKQGQPEEAIAAFTEAVTINPNYVNGWINRAQAYVQMEKYELAVADYSKLITLQPGNLQHYQSRAEAYRKLGNTSEAARDQAHVQWTRRLGELNRELARNAKDAAAWVARGRHLLVEDKFPEALADFDRALAVDADCVAAHLGRATVWTRQGKSQEALAVCAELIGKSGELEAYSLRGDIHLGQKNYQAAIEDYEVAHRFDSQVAQAYLGRAEAFKARGEIEQASADVAQAMSFDPKLRPANYEVSADEPQQVARPLPSRAER